MRLNDVLDNRQSETGTALLPRPGFIDPEKTFGYPWYVFSGNTQTGVGHGKLAPEARLGLYGLTPTVTDPPVRLYLIAFYNQVDQYLFNLIPVGNYFQFIHYRNKLQGDVIFGSSGCQRVNYVGDG